MEINLIYRIAIFLILALPLLVLPPAFYPPDWGKTIVFRSIIAILLFVFACQLLYKKNESNLSVIKNNKIVLLLLSLFLIFLLATIFSADPLFSLWSSPYRAGGFITFAFYFTFSLLAFFALKDSDWNKIWDFSILTGVAVCSIALIQFYGLFSNIFIPMPGRPPSTMGNPIILGIYLILLFFITLSFAIKEKGRKKIFYISSLLLFLYTILITGSRAAYLGLLLGIVYFVLFYLVKSKTKKKIIYFKISVIAFLIAAVFIVYYANSKTEYPKILAENRIFQAIQSRLSLESALSDPRFSAWKVAWSAIKEKPLFGWGPENFSIGFDKYYDPSLPFISKAWGGWWDKAHNILLDTAAQAGIPAAIIYLAFFVVLFWQLQKLKSPRQSAIIREDPIIPHGIQATLIGYFTANFFSFDSFSTYLLFFLIIGYSLHLTVQNESFSANQRSNQREINEKYKKAIIVVLLILLILFLWQYNLRPFQINTQIQKARFLSENQKCGQAFEALDKIIPRRSFLDAYSRIKYIEAIKTCAEANPDKNLEYAEKGITLMKEAIKMRPLYSRLWIFLGSFTTIKASYEQNPEAKKTLIEEAYSYFKKAEELAPSHQEVLLESAKTDMVSGNYQSMKEKSEKCAALEQSLGECYWIKALSEIYLKEFDRALADIKTAAEKRFDDGSILSLRQLTNAYAAAENYKELALVYEKLVKLKPDTPQYHSSLAFTYFKMKEYEKARLEALKFLELMPEEKEEVDAFLKMLR